MDTISLLDRIRKLKGEVGELSAELSRMFDSIDFLTVFDEIPVDTLLRSIIFTLDLSVHTSNRLEKNGITIIGNLVARTESELKKKGIGKKGTDEIKQQLKETFGLELGMKIPKGFIEILEEVKNNPEQNIDKIKIALAYNLIVNAIDEMVGQFRELEMKKIAKAHAQNPI